MKFRNLIPMLYTADINGTIAFYCDVLKFELDEYNADWGWCAMHNNGAHIMFALPNEHTPFEDGSKFTGSFYIYTEEVDVVWEQLKAITKVCYDIADFEHGMREFAIYDNNGYLLQFGKEISLNK